MSLLALTRLSMEPETGCPLLRHYPSVSFSSERTLLRASSRLRPECRTSASGPNKCGSRVDQL